jgi:hypothetical protein
MPLFREDPNPAHLSPEGMTTVNAPVPKDRGFVESTGHRLSIKEDSCTSFLDVHSSISHPVVAQRLHGVWGHRWVQVLASAILFWIDGVSAGTRAPNVQHPTGFDWVCR